MPPLDSRSTLFVVAAHVPDSLNRALLAETLRSIALFHPGQPILVVDNASPPGHLPSALKDVSHIGRVLVRTHSVSHGPLGAFQQADELLRGSELQPPPGRVVLLQHSTRLTRTLPQTPAGCAGLALGGTAFANMSATASRSRLSATSAPWPASWLSRSSPSMKWASAKAHALRMLRGPPRL